MVKFRRRQWLQDLGIPRDRLEQRLEEMNDLEKQMDSYRKTVRKWDSASLGIDVSLELKDTYQKAGQAIAPIVRDRAIFNEHVKITGAFLNRGAGQEIESALAYYGFLIASTAPRRDYRQRIEEPYEKLYQYALNIAKSSSWNTKRNIYLREVALRSMVYGVTVISEAKMGLGDLAEKLFDNILDHVSAHGNIIKEDIQLRARGLREIATMLRITKSLKKRQKASNVG